MNGKRFSHTAFLGYLSVMVFLYLMNAFSSANFFLQDMLCQKTTKPAPNIFVIGIDDKSLAAYGPWNTWSRSLMADMITLLNQDADNRPAVIGVDVMYFGTTPSDDALFSAAMVHDNLVFASEVNFASGIQQAENGAYHLNNMLVEGVTLPQAPLPEIAGHGFTNTLLDSDGRLRRSLLYLEYDGIRYDNFAYSIYQSYARTKGLPASPPPMDSNHIWTIAYNADVGSYGNGISFADVLSGNIPAALFKDSIVLIGSYASGMMDSYFTPVNHGEAMYGVEVNANMVQSLLEQHYLRNVPYFLQALFLLCMLLACRFFYRKPSALTKNMTLFTGTVGYLLVTALFSRFGWLLDPLYIPLGCGLLYIYEILTDYLRERRERLQTLETFQRYVSPEVAKHLLAAGDTSFLNPSGHKKQIAVLFVDIRGFTPLSESLKPEEVADILNEYLTLTSSIILQNGGTIDKFIGDATMALFNAPADLDDYVYKAVKTALEIAAGGKDLEEKLFRKYGKIVRFGIGVNCGNAVIGSIGAPFRMDYTAIGDTVNTAARLESAAAPGQILITDSILQTLEARIEVRFVENRQLKGKSQPIPLYEVLRLSLTQK